MSHASAPATILALAVGLGAALFVQPLRETAFADDWENTAMVRQIADSGGFERAASAATAPIPQLYLGAAVTAAFGGSHGALRASTLLFAALALFAFRHLCRDHGLSDREALVLTAALAAAPLFLVLSFTFLSEIPFLAGLVGSTVLLGRSLKHRSPRGMFVASLVVALTVLQRPLGLALVAAQAAFWLTSRSRRSEWRFFGAGLLLPLLAAAAHCVSPNWIWRARAAAQLRHLASPALLLELPWRFGAVIVYVGACALPIGLLALARATASRGAATGWRANRGQGAGRAARDLLVGTATVAAGLALGAALLERSWRLPWLDGELAAMRDWPAWLAVVASAVALVLAGGLASAVVSAARDRSGARFDESMLLLQLVLACLFCGVLLGARIRDRDVLALLPFLLLVWGRQIWTGGEPTRAEARTALFAAAAAAALVLPWIRGTLGLKEALWSASDAALARGLAPELVASSSREWQLAHGAFDRWLADQADPAIGAADAVLTAWTPHEFGRAKYWVLERTRESRAFDLTTVERREFRGASGRLRAVELVEPAFAVPVCLDGSVPVADDSGWRQTSFGRLVCRFDAEEVPGDSVVVRFQAAASREGGEIALRLGEERFAVPVGRSLQHFSSPAVAVPSAPLELGFTFSAPRLVENASSPSAFELRNLRLELAPAAISFATLAVEWTCSGGYARESQGASSWYWTADALDCVVTPSEDADGTMVVVFDYLVADPRRRLRARVGDAVRVERASGGWARFRSSPLAIAGTAFRLEVDLEGEGVAAAISPADARPGAFILRDVRLERVRGEGPGSTAPR